MVMSWSWPGVVTRVSRHHTFVTLVTCHTPWHVTQPSTHVTHCTHRTLFWFPLINIIISTRNIESCTYIDILCIKLESYLTPYSSVVVCKKPLWSTYTPHTPHTLLPLSAGGGWAGAGCAQFQTQAQFLCGCPGAHTSRISSLVRNTINHSI